MLIDILEVDLLNHAVAVRVGSVPDEDSPETVGCESEVALEFTLAQPALNLIEAMASVAKQFVDWFVFNQEPAGGYTVDIAE